VSIRRRCNQCWKFKPRAEFVGARGGIVQDCSGCRRKRRNGTRQATRRALIDSAEFAVLFIPESKDRKLGGIPASYSSGSTCPDACALKDAGCYGEFGFLRAHWERVAELGGSWGSLLAQVRRLSPGTLWRHNVVGDLPGVNNTLDVARLALLVRANQGRRGFTFTHKPLRSVFEQKAVADANAAGFTINLSADSLDHADALAELGIAPVVVTLPSDAPRFLYTPAGRRVVVCPAQAAELDCATCGLCARAGRKGIVGFRAHGQWKAKINGRVSLPVLAPSHLSFFAHDRGDFAPLKRVGGGSPRAERDGGFPWV
jgi:hypothetical protein